MDLGVFIKGVIIGFSIAAPVGPIGVLCIRRTLAEGRASGFLSGLGAATADTLYGCIASFGLSFVANFLTSQHTLLRFAGGLCLCMLGLKTFFSEPASQPAAVRGKGLAAAYFSTFLLTLTNPLTILAFAAIFAAFGIKGAGVSYWGAIMLIGGVFLGSTLWWFLLSSLVSTLRAKVDVRVLHWVNRISGVIITIFGVLVLLNIFET